MTEGNCKLVEVGLITPPGNGLGVNGEYAMFNKRKNRKQTRNNSKPQRQRPIDVIFSGHIEAALWLNRESSRASYGIQLSRRHLDQNGRLTWSRNFGPEDIPTLTRLVVKMAEYFSHDDLLSRRLRRELRAYAEVFAAAHEAMEFAEAEASNVHHLNGVNKS